VYGAAKLAGEYYTKAYRVTYGLPTLIVRPFNAYGPRAHTSGELAEVIPRMIIRVRNGRPPVVFGDGENGRDFTYVTELAQAIAHAGEMESVVGEVVNIAYGQLVTLNELAVAIPAACGRPDLKPEYVDARPGDVHRLSADTRLARREICFSPRIDIMSGLARYIEWFDRTYPDPSHLIEDEVKNWTLPPA
jgi:UDP-glucose 4-epimerase